MAVRFQDYYEILGVKRDATKQEIQRAYRGLARKFHPDVNKAADASDKFKKIGEAYEVLKDPEKRKRYDRLGANWKNGQEFTPPPEWGEQMFRGAPGSPGSGNGRRGRPGGGGPAGGGFTFQPGGQFSDFFEMFFGGDSSAMEEMLHRGGAPGGGPGRGGGPMQQPMQEVEMAISLEEAHRGSTRQLQLQGPQGAQRIDVKIPAGITPGKKIRLKEHGILLKVAIQPHPRFAIEGNDLTVTLPVTPWEAALGAKVPVKTLDDEVTLTIPPGTSSGARMRLKGKGLGGGDLYVRIRIDVPKTLTDKEREIYEQLKEESKHNPRSG